MSEGAREIIGQSNRVSKLLERYEAQDLKRLADHERAVVRYNARVSRAIADTSVAERLARRSTAAECFASRSSLARAFEAQDRASRAVRRTDFARIAEQQRTVAGQLERRMSPALNLQRNLASWVVDASQHIAPKVDQVSKACRALTEWSASVEPALSTWGKEYFRLADIAKYYEATGTIIAPGSWDDRPTVVIVPRDTRSCPYLPALLRASGWRVIELHPYDERTAWTDQAPCDELETRPTRRERGRPLRGRWRCTATATTAPPAMPLTARDCEGGGSRAATRIRPGADPGGGRRRRDRRWLAPPRGLGVLGVRPLPLQRP